MFKKYLFFSLMFILPLLFGGCGDDKISGQEEHYDAVGIVIYQSGVKMLDYYGPDYQAGDSVAYMDTLHGSIGLNPHWNAKFYNDDEEEIDPPLTPDEGGQQTLAAVFDPELGELWWHDNEDGHFEFHLRGLQSGNGIITFKVMHLGHSDFTTLPIPLVIDSEVLHDAPIGVKLLDEESGDLLATAWLADSAHAEGALTIAVNDSTDHIEVLFFDINDTEFLPGVPPHSLIVESSDTTMVTIGGQEAEEPWAFKLYGHNTGSAAITIYLYHDDAIGKTFSPVTVNVQ